MRIFRDRLPNVLAFVLLSGAAAQAQPFPGPELALSRPASPGGGAEVAVAADGSFVATWVSSTAEPPASDVFVRLFGPDGRPRGRELSVASQARGHQSEARVALAKNGSFVVVWLVDVTGRTGPNRVFARRFDRDGHPRGGPFPVTVAPSLTKDGQYGPGVAIAPDGRILVLWSHDTGERAEDGIDIFDLRARWFADDGHALGAPIVLERGFLEADLGRARFDRDGSLVVVFEGHGGEPTFFDVFLKRFDRTGAPLGEAVRINNDPLTLPTSQQDPDFAIGADGSLFVVWTDTGADFVRHLNQQLTIEDGFGLVAQRVGASGELLGPPLAVNRFFRGEQGRASVAATADGGFFVVWQSGAGQDGSGEGVFGRRYDASGAPIGRELSVPLQRTNDQVAPWIALNANGHGVVTWTTVENGRVVGTFGRLFGP